MPYTESISKSEPVCATQPSGTTIVEPRASSVKPTTFITQTDCLPSVGIR